MDPENNGQSKARIAFAAFIVSALIFAFITTRCGASVSGYSSPDSGEARSDTGAGKLDSGNGSEEDAGSADAAAKDGGSQTGKDGGQTGRDAGAAEDGGSADANISDEAGQDANSPVPGDAHHEDAGQPPVSADETSSPDEGPPGPVVIDETVLPGGAYADVAVSGNDFWIISENETRNGVYIYRNNLLEEEVRGPWPYVLYVRGCAYPGGAAAAFQAGDYPTAYWDGLTFTWWEDGKVFGIEVAAIEWTGTEFLVAYMVQGFLVKRWVQEDGTTIRRELVQTPTTQGINRVYPDGTVTLVDDTRTDDRYPLLYRPWEADGHVAVGECRDDPPRGLGYKDGRPFLLLEGLAYRPRALPFGNGYIAESVGTAGIRVVRLPPFNYLQ